MFYQVTFNELELLDNSILPAKAIMEDFDFSRLVIRHDKLSLNYLYEACKSIMLGDADFSLLKNHGEKFDADSPSYCISKIQQNKAKAEDVLLWIIFQSFKTDHIAIPRIEITCFGHASKDGYAINISTLEGKLCIEKIKLL